MDEVKVPTFDPGDGNAEHDDPLTTGEGERWIMVGAIPAVPGRLNLLTMGETPLSLQIPDDQPPGFAFPVYMLERESDGLCRAVVIDLDGAIAKS